jgi:hypothetical protein
MACPAQRETQPVDHFRPFGVPADLFTQKSGLAGAPEGRLGQREVRRQRSMGGDETADRGLVRRQPQLCKKIREAV